MKSIAESKFALLIQSCHYYSNSVPRVHLFSRFLGIYDGYSEKESNKYLELLEIFKIEEIPNSGF